MFLSNVLTVHLSEASVKLNCTTYSYSTGWREREGGLERKGEREKMISPGGEEGRVKVARD